MIGSKCRGGGGGGGGLFGTDRAAADVGLGGRLLGLLLLGWERGGFSGCKGMVGIAVISMGSSTMAVVCTSSLQVSY